MTAPYPLHWPSGWARTNPVNRRPAPFNRKVDNGRYAETKRVTLTVARERLDREFELVRATGVTLSMNVELNLRGHPRSGDSTPRDPGVALYFKMRDGQQWRDLALACDKWDRVPDNIVALAKHIEALRGMDRWGVGTAAQAFAGYAALPAPECWWQILGVEPTATADQVEAAYRLRAREHHPDTGGDPARMAAINAARDEARKAQA